MKPLLVSFLLLVTPVAWGQSVLPSGTGWHSMSNTALQPNGVGGAGDVCPPDNFGGGGDPFDTKCPQVILAWSGGTYDSISRRMILFGGGHTDYSGNQLQFVDMSTATPSMVRATNPTTPTGSQPAIPSGCVGAACSPTSRHTYNGLAFIPSVGTRGSMFVTGGSENPSGSEGADTWLADMAAMSGACVTTHNCTGVWTRKADAPAGGNLDGKCAVWDPVDAKIYFNDRNSWYSWTPATNTWSGALRSTVKGLRSTCAIDPDRRIILVGGTGDYFTVSISNGTISGETSHTVGACAFASHDYPGLAYDKKTKNFVGYNGDGTRTIYVVNESTWACTTEDDGGTTPPPATTFAASGQGGNSGTQQVFGRFAYMDDEDAFVLVADSNQNAFYLRRNAGPTQRTLAQRCNESNAIICLSMDDSVSTSGIVCTTNCLGPVPNPVGIVAGNQSTAVLDNTNPTPTNLGSLKFTVTAAGTQNSAGSFTNQFRNQQFGSGTNFWFSYRMMVDSNYSQNYNAAGQKNFIVYPNANSCNSLQFVQINENYVGWARLYRSCSPDLLAPMADGDQAEEFGAWNPPTDPTVGNQGYLCTFRGGTGRRICALYTPNVWITYIFHVTVNNVNGSNNRIEAWVEYPTDTFARKYFDHPQVAWTTSAPDTAFTTIDLLPYDTGRTTTVANASNVWYAELIVSPSQINPPTGTLDPSGSGVPSVNLNPSTLVFGNQTVNTTSNAQNVTLLNSGTATLTISSISLTGTNNGDFAISSNTCGTSLGIASSCVVSVTFHPTTLAGRSASLTFTTNAATSPDNVALSGTGQAPIATFSPLSLSFGGIKVGLSSTSQPINLTNSGNAVITISSITLTGDNLADYSQNNNCGSSLGVGLSCTINVTFIPITIGIKAANVSVSSNTATSPDLVPLSGTGFLPVIGVGTISGSGTIKVQP